MTPAPFHSARHDPPSPVQAFWLQTEDGLRLRAAHWPAARPLGSVLLMQGRAEYHEKYSALAARLNAAGLDVLSVEWRGQGLSDRLHPDPFLSHIPHYGDYQRDVVELVVAAQDLRLPQPWHLLAHSMGGAIGLGALLSDLPVQSAVFTAPMWGLNPHHMAIRVAAWISALAHKLGHGARFMPGSGGRRPFVLGHSFEENLLTSDGFEWGQLIAHAADYPQLTLGGVTCEWLHQSLLECRRLAQLPPPDLPALIFLGSDESVVSAPAIRERAANWPKARLIGLKGAKHEPMIEHPAIQQQFLSAALEHFLPTA